MPTKPNFVVKAKHNNKKGSTVIGAGWVQSDPKNGVNLSFDISVVGDRFLVVLADNDAGAEGANYLSSLLREDKKPSFVLSVPKNGDSAKYPAIVGSGWVQADKEGELEISISLDLPVCIERAFLNVRNYD